MAAINFTTSDEIQSHQALMKRRNLSAILLALLHHQPIARTHLAQITNLSPTTITKITANLLETGIIAEDLPETIPGRQLLGRPRTALSLVPQSRYAVGVYLRVGEFEVSITDLQAQVLHYTVYPYDHTADAQIILGQMADNILAEIHQHRIPLERLVGVGIGLNGSVDPQTGVNLFAPGLNWHNMPVRDYLVDRLPVPVCVDNNIRLMALGETMFNRYRDIRHMALVSVHQGLGLGLIVDGKLVHGAYAAAGEIGRMYFPLAIDSSNQPLRSVSLETLIAVGWLLSDAAKVARQTGDIALGDYLSGTAPDRLERLFETARTGNTALQDFLAQRAYFMGIALANLVNMFNPELVLLAGDIYLKGRDLMLAPTESAMRAHLFGDLGKLVRLEVVDPDRRIGVIGAAAFALDTYFYQSSI